MNNFNLRAFLSNNSLHENMDVEITAKVAQKIADAFTAEDKELDLKYVVNPRIDPSSFDLDVEAGPNTPGPEWKDKNGFGIDNYLGEFAGGSFYIKNGIVYNAASRNAPVAKVSPEGEVEMISSEKSRAAIGRDVAYPEIDMDRYNDELSRMEENKEETKSNKMKKSELKEMIKSAFLNETSIEETLVDADQDMAEAILNALGGEAAFEAVVRAMSTDDAQTYLGAIMRDHDIEMGPAGDIPGFEGTMDALDSLKIREAEEDEEVDVEAEETEDVEATDVAVDDTETVDVEASAEISPEVKATQDALTAAIEAAKALGDQKLADQIGNSITFFTRTHVVGQDKVAEDLTMERMLKNAGIKK
jgi:hypothetical protein